MAKSATIEEYITAAPEPVRKKLVQLHQCIRKAAPDAKEGIKWGMPAYSYHRILVTFAAFEHHIGFYPTPSAVSAFADSLGAYKTAASSIQFQLDKPLPLSLIRKIVAFRVKESLLGDAKWKS